MAGMDEVNMTQLMMEDIRDNGAGAQFNRDMVIGHISPKLQEIETELRRSMTPEIIEANANFAAGKITEGQRDKIVLSVERQLDRQSDLNDRVMKKR